MMKLFAIILSSLALTAHGADVVLGRRSDMTWSGAGTTQVASFGAADVTAGLVAWWKFNEGTGTTTVDSISSYSLSVSGGAVWTNGKSGNALWFDGVNDHASMIAPPAFLLTNYTLTAWVKPYSNGGNLYSTIAGRLIPGAPYVSYSLAQYTDGKWYAGISATPSTYQMSDLTTNAWTFLAISYNGANLIGFANDSTGFVRSVSATINTNAGTFSVAGFNFSPSAGSSYKGIVDDVRLYNRALSSNEVYQIWNKYK